MENNRPDAKPADSVIRFACNFCGRKIRVPATFAGKKGKCPNCKKVVLIPESSTPQPPEKPGEPIRLNRNLDPRHISKASVPDAQSDAMDDIERHLQPLPDQQQITPEQKQLLNLWSERFPGQDEPEPESDLPWFIDLLAYPFNVSGIIHLFLFWAIPVLLSLTQPFFMFTPYGALLWLILAVFFWGYVFYYLFRCLIASAKGKHRALTSPLKTRLALPTSSASYYSYSPASHFASPRWLYTGPIQTDGNRTLLTYSN